MSGPYVSGSTQPLEIICSNCGQACAAGMRFCNRCGQPLAAAPAPSMAPSPYPPPPPQQAQPYYPPPAQPPPYHQPEYPSYQPQQAHYAPPPQAPYPPQYAQPMPAGPVRSPKSVGLGFLLALIFGPLGLFYATAGGGIIMLLVSVGAWTFFYTRVGSMSYYDPGFTSSGPTWLTLMPLVIWLGVTLICVVWAITAINSYNNKLRARSMY
ncbi:MAG: hypothetical protein M3328_07665 [Chloroflexota bacterium]|nr:hypothetical protein [Chloroflexota bacterium]